MAHSIDSTPILIGVGQVTESVPEDFHNASSNVDLAAQAARLALQDAGGDSLASNIDVIVMARTFPDSSPAYRAPFGGSNNPPRSVAKRLDCDPAEAIYSKIGGHTPQALVNEFSQRLHAGSANMVLLCGAEVQANSRVAQKFGATLNWSEKVEGSLDDRGLSTDNLFTQQEFAHQVVLPMQFYALMENARCAESGVGHAEYRQTMGDLFARIASVAADNPLAVDQSGYSSSELITPSDNNPMVIWPYTKRLISKDTVNQAAALLMTTVGAARKLGIDQNKWVYLHGYADVNDRFLLERERLGFSHALEQCLHGALNSAGKSVDDIQHLDLYSCFPVVVADAVQAIGLDLDDPRRLTQTGGLPYFGGPGNNYSMHGIAETVNTLRDDRASYGLVLANGGWMSKISVGIYSTKPAKNWQPHDSIDYQRAADAAPRLSIQNQPSGEATIDSYTFFYHQGHPVKPLIIGRLNSTGERFYAQPYDADTHAIEQLMQDSPIGKTVFVQHAATGNRFAFDADTLAKLTAPRLTGWRDNYLFCDVARDHNVLTVTLNRPELGNALHPPANLELDEIFNTFDDDDSLHVAILIGSGAAHFCAGNDLKYMASGKPMFLPRSGFGGLTSRTHRSKPIIAALNGDAMGGGLEIALACDLVVAAEHAKLALPEVNVGLFAGAGGIQRLTRQIGRKPAMEMLLTGRPVNANRALSLGLVNDVVPLEELSARAQELASQIAQASPHAIKCTMRVEQKTAEYASESAAVTAEHGVFDELINGNDFWEGPRAFAEKRKPNWRK
ncbi:enoyl-CoA hydratase-related protein [Arenicella xantha]|uniref:Acetyl-CoA C-acetyltransferase n=1 Tax=Arenicella xantha TaxID=644221 RepID=A0A395JLS5_9GAMM|nr:enoyl-CoA hydratase-related protein [Arenicella xantha]RBP51661.1 acetyl-CoA C-acetyltransferase [Arenicella xantha]